jgi:hypothetical protein
MPCWVKDLSKQNVRFSRCSVSFLPERLSADEQYSTEMNILIGWSAIGRPSRWGSLRADVLVPDGRIVTNEIG